MNQTKEETMAKLQHLMELASELEVTIVGGETTDEFMIEYVPIDDLIRIMEMATGFTKI